MAGVPDLLTVEEAARVMRIGRTKAYALAREWRATNGRSGLPVVDIGNVLRVPRQRLEQLLGRTLTTCDAWASSPRSMPATLQETGPCAGDDRNVQLMATATALRSAETPAPPSTTVSTATSTASPRRHRHARPASQLDLFGTPSPSSAER